MTPPLLAAAGLGLLLGLRHAFEPDHLAAVSTLASRQGRLVDGARLGLAWSLGHSATVAAVTLVVLATGFQLPEAFSAAAELLVAFLLVVLGLPVVVRYARGRWHMHTHRHEGQGAPHLHLHSHGAGSAHVHAHPAWDARRSLGLGVAHGLAGSAAIVVLLAAAAPTAAARVAYVTAFGAGTVLGMLTVSLAIGLLGRVASRRGERWASLLHVGSAAASVAAGVVLALRVMGGIAGAR
jgi:ABC-type nickel/cobalt efflux system permease component RcnA